MAHEKRVWEYRMGELMKTKKILQGNLHCLFMVLMSLFDSNTKKQVESMSKYPGRDKTLDSIGLLNLIKKLVYTCDTRDLNTRHKKATAFLNLMNLHHEKFQSIQNFQDQYIAIKKVCDLLEPVLDIKALNIFCLKP